MKFGVVLMTVFIPVRFFLHILFECLGEVDAGLIGQADEDPEYVSHFIGEPLP